MLAHRPILVDPVASDDATLALDALELGGIGAFSCDLGDDALTWTPATYRIFGLAPDMRVDRRAIVEMYSTDSRATLDNLRGDAIARCGRFAFDAQIHRTDGARRWMRLTAQVVATGGRARRLYGLKQDVTDEKTRLDLLRRMVEHDPVTGLPARVMFEERMADRGGGAMILFGIDGLKALNDRLGRDVGDACLCVVAERIAAALPDDTVLARIGGGEFAALVSHASGLALARRVSALLLTLALPIACDGQIVRLTASAGIAMAVAADRFDPVRLIAGAQGALHAAWADGGNAIRIVRID
jgi:diguanylate cyclase (GGDEF)-like protein